MTDVQTPADSDATRDPDSRWRGVAAEDIDEVAATKSIVLRDRSRRLLGSLLRPHRRTLIAILVVVLIENAARLAVPFLVKEGIDKGIPPMKAGDGPSILIGIIVAVVAIVAVQAVTRQVFLIMAGRVGQQTLLELRRRLFKQFQRLTPAFHDRYTSGRVISRSTSDVDAIEEMLDTGFDGLITAALTLLGTAVMLLVLDLELGLIALLSFPFLLALTVWFRRQSALTYRRTRVTIAALIVHFVESMTGIRAVQAFRRERRNEELFAEVNDDNRVANENAFRLVALFMPGIKLIGNITIAAVLLIGAYRVFDGAITIGVLTAFLLYLRQFFEPMQEISQFYNSFQSASAALEKLSGVLEEEPEVEEPVDPVALGRVRGELCFDRVGFEYQPDRPVLPGLDLHVPAGQTLALVGTTGAGKTTIAKLLARFYDPTSGTVRLDDIDLRRIADDDLRRDVVMVTQENFIFAGTIADNIRLGKPDATDDEVRRAADAIGASSFIEAMPLGYDTQVESRGGRLSAGQNQLIAFARAFLADPAVLILDEATSSLDVPSERLVQRALRTILADRTSIIIAHRLTTVEVADRVVVLEHGRIVEDGAPHDLIAAGEGQYARLHDAWLASLA